MLTVSCAIFGLLLCSCGGITTWDGLSITVTPAQATVAPGSTLTLAGTAGGFNETEPVIFWTMSSGGLGPGSTGGKDPCAIDPSAPRPNFSTCSCGYVLFKEDTGRHSTATYVAPPATTRVKCFPTFSAIQASPFYAKSGSAEITVSP